MVECLNLGLKVKILGPLLAFMGVGGPVRAQAISVGVTVGWGGWARKLASDVVIVYKIRSKRAKRAPRREASAPRSGAQPILEYQSSNVIYSLGKCLANQSQPS